MPEPEFWQLTLLKETAVNIANRLLIALICALLVGCASSKSGSVYTREQARHEMTIRQGIVESVREVGLEGTKSGVGTMAGAAVGGVAGSNVGGGKGQIVGAILGALVGGLAGGGGGASASGSS